MALYCIGDIQGCNEALGRLLDDIAFSPSRDTIFVLGDLVNRGPDSAGVLRRLMRFGEAARCLLGNHDLHLLALAEGASKVHRHDTLDDILAAPDRPAMLDWLRRQPLAVHEPKVGGNGLLMVHAGVLPSWTAEQAVALADEVHAVLRGSESQLADFLHEMYGNQPNAWRDDLTGSARLRVIINALTRLRFCSASGAMEFATKEGAASAPAGYLPWFDVPGRRTSNLTVAFGHWSSLGHLDRPDVIALDTGCVWGGCLSAIQLKPGTDTGPAERQWFQVQCAATLKPGG